MAAGAEMIRFDFSGAKVLITGGTSGIGAGLAKAYAAAGAEVTITGTRAGREAYEDAPGGCAYRQLVLSDADAVDALAANCQALDILINNAGGTQTPEDFASAIDINLNAVFRLSSGLKSVLARSTLPGGASILNIASMMSFYGSTYFPGYSAAKGGLILLTKSLAQMWASENIRVNAIAPGAIRTRMTEQWAAHPDFGPAVVNQVALGRWGGPGDIVGPAMFLTSPAAAFVTGETLVVGGGYKLTD